jgi:DedD protein
MAFFKFPWLGKRSGSEEREPAPVRRSRAAQAHSVEQMRTRARHRLLGAAVLIVAGVIGFPLLFDSQPRPIPVDIPIEIPDRNKVAPLVVPGEQAQTHGATPDMRPPQSQNPQVAEPELDDDGEVWTPVPPPMPPQPPRVVPQPAPKPAPKPEPKPEPKPAPKPEIKPEPKPEPPKPAATPSAAEREAARARALLEGKAPPPPAAASPAAAAPQGGRFIVQVGAFADVAAANEVRRKLEGAGLKTYTQTVNTAAGPRTRVRLGPFSNREDALKAAERAKALGLAGAVLTL